MLLEDAIDGESYNLKLWIVGAGRGIVTGVGKGVGVPFRGRETTPGYPGERHADGFERYLRGTGQATAV